MLAVLARRVGPSMSPLLAVGVPGGVLTGQDGHHGGRRIGRHGTRRDQNGPRPECSTRRPTRAVVEHPWRGGLSDFLSVAPVSGQDLPVSLGLLRVPFWFQRLLFGGRHPHEIRTNTKTTPATKSNTEAHADPEIIPHRDLYFRVLLVRCRCGRAGIPRPSVDFERICVHSRLENSPSLSQLF